jgi:hypothetical protein
LEELAPLPEPVDPLEAELPSHRQELSVAEARLQEEQGRREPLREQQAEAERQAEALAARCRQLEAVRGRLAGAQAEQGKAGLALALSLRELSDRSRRLLAELEALRQAPSLKKTLRYRTPVSQPVSEEVMFECLRGKVTLIDIGALVEQMRREMSAKERLLRSQWLVTGATDPVGPYRLRFVLERERSLLDTFGGGQGPVSGFRYAATRWEVEPVVAERGESGDQALAAGSAFLKVVEHINPKETAVTLWVYPDSFALYRRLRDVMHDRAIMVAGRPLPEGVPIASSRDGTVSRGQ